MIDELTAPPLPEWLARDLPFRRRAARIDGRVIHFVDHGEGRPVVLMHGNPTWSFLWRKVIARLVEKPGVRVIAPDLLGCGLSTKLARPSEHSLALHVETMASLYEALDLRDYVVAGQDWGGPIGVGAAMVRAASARPPSGLVISNTAILSPARPFRPKSFHRFSHAPVVSDLVFRGLLFPVPVLLSVQGDRSSLGLRELAAYAWPLRRLRDRAAPVGLARMVPNAEEHPSTGLLDRLGAFTSSFGGPVELVWGERDPILGRALRRHQEALPNARVTTTNAGHFLQEEVPDELATAIRRVATG